MKRIINGVTYNTDTATMIARADGEETDLDDVRIKGITLWLYQTRGGAFFLHINTEINRRNFEGELRVVARDEFEPLTASEAREWIVNSGYQVEILNDVFGEPPEAVAEEAPGATIYLRVPAALKAQLEAAANEDKLSLNALAMRCLETCMAARKANRRKAA